MIGTALANQITFTDTTAVPSQPYSYRVTAFNAAGNSPSNVLVVKATPVITWATPAPISFGTPLGGAQLNATASVPGTFVYTPAAGTVLAVGPQLLSALFTPTDSANYNTVTASVTLVVGQTVPVITWATPAPIVYGTALSGVQLNATASVPGTFVYTPDVGAVLNAEATLYRSSLPRPTPLTTPRPRLASHWWSTRQRRSSLGLRLHRSPLVRHWAPRN